VILKFKQLESVFDQLSPSHQQSVIEFASYLLDQHPYKAPERQKLEPQLIERPAEESVVSAIKRLKQTYQMLDTDTLLNKASALMGQHLLQGCEAHLVIDELEALFLSRYEEYRQK